jgi:hypothetical protein
MGDEENKIDTEFIDEKGFQINEFNHETGAKCFVHEMYGRVLDMTFLSGDILRPILRNDKDLAKYFLKQISQVYDLKELAE